MGVGCWMALLTGAAECSLDSLDASGLGGGGACRREERRRSRSRSPRREEEKPRYERKCVPARFIPHSTSLSAVGLGHPQHP